MKQRDDVSTGKFISLILRHKPEVIDLSIDANGWANVEELIEKMNKHNYSIDIDSLKRIVNNNNKQRYSFSDDMTKIRANQGHSISVDVELIAKNPPEYLYHGTAKRFVESIWNKGILKGSRQHVHLSEDTKTAKVVGNRHGEPAIVQIFANKMAQDGIIFYQSVNGVWLCDDIPVKYIAGILHSI